MTPAEEHPVSGTGEGDAKAPCGLGQAWLGSEHGHSLGGSVGAGAGGGGSRPVGKLPGTPLPGLAASPQPRGRTAPLQEARGESTAGDHGFVAPQGSAAPPCSP